MDALSIITYVAGAAFLVLVALYGIALISRVNGD